MGIMSAPSTSFAVACLSESPFGDSVVANPVARAALDWITAQDYLENPELKVYVEDALRLVLAARPERPLDLINEYMQSVLALDNVVGREYAYVNATMRNRRAFIIAIHEIFVGGGRNSDDGENVAPGGNDNRIHGHTTLGRGAPWNPSSVDCEAENDRASRSATGFEQRDLVHLLGLVCPDFPEDTVGWVARILYEGMGDVNATPLGIDTKVVEKSGSPSRVSSTDPQKAVDGDRNDHRVRVMHKISFEVFVQAFSIYLYFQEFFEDVCVLFASMAVERGVTPGDSSSSGTGTEDVMKAGKVNLRMLLDQLQLMKAEPRNQLRYMDVRYTEAAARKGGLKERVSLPSFMACLLLHSEALAKQLLDRPVADRYGDRLEACPALWNDWTDLGLAGEMGDIAAESLGRKKKGARRGSAARPAS